MVGSLQLELVDHGSRVISSFHFLMEGYTSLDSTIQVLQGG